MKRKSDPFAGTHQSIPAGIGPKEFFDYCAMKEEEFLKTPYSRNVRLMLEHMLFSHPLFDREPWGQVPAFKQVSRELYPFNFSIAPLRPLTISEPEWRYRMLLKYLKKSESAELRLLLVARWMKQEGICEPEHFLPKEIRDSLVKRFGKRIKISPNDLRYARIIHTWRHYFKQVEAALRSSGNRKRKREHVVSLGFQPVVVEWVYKKRSIIQAICGWLGIRKHLDPRNLRNIYSRQYSNRRRRLVASLS